MSVTLQNTEATLMSEIYLVQILYKLFPVCLQMETMELIYVYIFYGVFTVAKPNYLKTPHDTHRKRTVSISKFPNPHWAPMLQVGFGVKNDQHLSWGVCKGGPPECSVRSVFSVIR